MSIHDALASGPRTSKEIQATLGWSQAKVSRAVHENEDIVQLPGRRPYRYAATKPAFGSTKVPVAQVDTHGKNVPRGVLNAIRPSGYLVEPFPGFSIVLAGVDHNGTFDGLPYYMDDARPQGFLGKLIAQRLSEQSDEFVSDPDLWSEEMVGRYLLSNGDDLPGNFVFGFSMMNRLRKSPYEETRERYPKIADATLEGFEVGSLAGGQQQKFTAFIKDIESHVIVKFSPSQDDLTSRRWRDILVTEYHALTVLGEIGYSAAETRLLDLSTRYFLESKRFDRRGRFGRSSMFSLRTVDAEFVGSGGSWIDVFEALYNDDLVSLFDLENVKELQLFGRLIHNTDMHLGNLSVEISGNMFSLLPAYDMCSMGFAPKGTEVTHFAFSLPEKESVLGLPESPRGQIKVIKAAATFWQRVCNDDLVSAEFRDFIRERQFVQQLQSYSE